jgi:hypothetical protein
MTNLTLNHKTPEILSKLSKQVHLEIGSQPPKKSKIAKLDISIILKYSDRKNRTEEKEEYSTLKPETNSDSASGKSKGVLLVSASIIIKNKIKEGSRGKK